MPKTKRQEELRKFLRARRASLAPNAPNGHVGRRRTPGLRREEVASLADVSLTWYTWLEQGRDIQVSRAALERIAHALRLSSSDRHYLSSLALKNDGHADVSDSRLEVDGSVQTTLDNFVCNPAFLTNTRHDLLAFNRLANLIFDFEKPVGRFRMNTLWQLLTNPERRKLVVNWRELVAGNVGVFRVSYGSRVGDPRFEELLEALRGIPEFVEIWEDQRTAPLEVVPASYKSPILGRLNVYAIRAIVPARPDDVMVVFAPADARTAAAFLEHATVRV